ncbi:MAG: restriction endonuclease [Abditibacteriota bacterium]|nr:restriction endonuclease [Abditibacteriota bacterium]
MELNLPSEAAEGYRSPSQRIRVMTEAWFGANMYCINCGNPAVSHTANNSPAADFVCEKCREIYELKSHKGNPGTTIPDGEYCVKIQRITSNTNPDLFVLTYNDDYEVSDLLLIPRFFFVTDIIEKRPPLRPGTRRAGWVGSSIRIGSVPAQGIIPVIQRGTVIERDDVLRQYGHVKALQTDRLEARGWLLDVLNCVNDLGKTDFSLSEMYSYGPLLGAKHTGNNNVEAKIRQQLQLLRDKGFIEFTGKGRYRRLY